MRCSISIMVILAGCPAPLEAPSESEPEPASASERECVRDQDCALLPYADCCGECPPSPPFEVGTREDLDAIFIELESKCALDRRECEPPACEPVPEACSARAACVDGRCVVEADGCGRPTI